MKTNFSNQDLSNLDWGESLSIYNYKTMSNFGTLNWGNIKNGLVWAVLTAIIAMIAYAISVGDLWEISTKSLTNIGAMALFNGILSIFKSFITTKDGEVAGVVNVY